MHSSTPYMCRNLSLSLPILSPTPCLCVLSPGDQKELSSISNIQLTHDGDALEVRTMQSNSDFALQ